MDLCGATVHIPMSILYSEKCMFAINFVLFLFYFIFFRSSSSFNLTQATHHRCRDCRFVVVTTICYNSCFYSHFLLVCFIRFVTRFNYLFLRFEATSRINGCRINAQTIVIIRLICTDNGNFLCFLFTVK